MIKAIIIGNELSTNQNLVKICNTKFIDRINIIDCCTCLKDGANLIKINKPDVVFIDWELNDDNVFSLFNCLEILNFAVILIIADNNYTIQTFKISVFDYLHKPISEIALAETLEKFERNKINHISLSDFKLFLENYSIGNELPRKVAFPTSTGCRIININQITCCLANDNYTLIEIYDGQRFLVSKTLKVIEEVLPKNIFFRIHKSTLININYVRSYINRNENSVILENGRKYNVAIRRKEDLEKVIANKFGNLP
jgi:two-component system, LytTR family, response regulator